MRGLGDRCKFHTAKPSLPLLGSRLWKAPPPPPPPPPPWWTTTTWPPVKQKACSETSCSKPCASSPAVATQVLVGAAPALSAASLLD